MEDFDIEIISESSDNNKPVQLPLNFLTIGEIENDDVKVYIKQNVYKELEKYASSDTAHELGTIILGDYSEDLGKMHVVISDFIYAKYTDASASTLTFTHETWDYVHREHEEKYPDKRIVGWQHTHPGYGIFLSNYDMFIQENFFNTPFQVAYVIDPVQHLRGFFQWKNGKVEKLNGYYIYDDIGEKIKIDPPKTKISDSLTNDSTVNKNKNMIQPIAIGILSALTIFLIWSVYGLSTKYNRQLEKQKILEEQITDQRMMIAEQANELSSVKESINQSNIAEMNDPEETDTDTIEEPVHIDENNEEKASEDGTDINEESSHKEPYDTVTLRPYIVKSGDSLVAICNEKGIDYSSTYRIILSLNGIDNPNEIFIGQTILLPISD